MDLEDPGPQSDEGMLVSLSTLSGPGFGNSPASESVTTTRMIDTPSSSPLNLGPLHQVNAPGHSYISDGLPFMLLPNHVYSPQDRQDVHKYTSGPDISIDISSNTTQQLAEESKYSRYNVNSSINPPVCATAGDFDAVTRQTMEQHMPGCSPGDHQFTGGVGDSLIKDELLTPSNPNIHSGLLAGGDLAATTSLSDLNMLHSEISNLQRDPAPSYPLSAVTDNHFHEPSLPPKVLVLSKDDSDDRVQMTIAPHLPESQTAIPLSLLLKSSHASYTAYNNNIAGSDLVTDKTSTSHVDHENSPIDFAPEHSYISSPLQIDHTEEDPGSHASRAPSPSLDTQDMGILEDFTSSPLSPSMSPAYMPSSSPIPSSSPVEPSFQTPPTSPPSSPVKNTQQETWRSNDELLIPGTPSKFNNVPTDGRYSTIPSSAFADPHTQKMISREVSTLPVQTISSSSDHYVEFIVAENRGNRSVTTTFLDATTRNTEGEAGLSKESEVEQKKLDSNVDVHRLKSTNTIPYPKRPTIAAHRLQQKKLAQPFRSPVLPQAPQVELKPKAIDTMASPSPIPKEAGTSQESSYLPTLDSKIKYRTRRAAAQFKSPLSAPNASDDTSLVRLTPTIQALERKLQILKRAVKVREDVQEEVLESLVKKWSEAGREVAWEVWNLIKDSTNPDSNSQSSKRGKKRAFEGSWGWESSGDAKRERGEEKERNWGWDVVPISERIEEEEEEEGNEECQHSLGRMLMELGVAADTLGWVEEEGTFIDK